MKKEAPKGTEGFKDRTVTECRNEYPAHCQRPPSSHRWSGNFSSLSATLRRASSTGGRIKWFNSHDRRVNFDPNGLPPFRSDKRARKAVQG